MQANIPLRSAAALCALAGVLLLGCTRDPNVQKQKYFQSGAQYLQSGKYREAAIEFQNAIQIDPRFVQAHYQLAQTYLKESLWNSAYQELLRTRTSIRRIPALSAISRNYWWQVANSKMPMTWPQRFWL